MPALVMEFVDATTLADRIERGTIPVDEALLIAKQIGGLQKLLTIAAIIGAMSAIRKLFKK